MITITRKLVLLWALGASFLLAAPDWPISLDISPYRNLAELERSELLLTGLRPSDPRLRAHTLMLAARQLRHYLLRITSQGAHAFPIHASAAAPDGVRGFVLSVEGAAASAELQEEGSFALTPVHDGLRIHAATAVGVLYGVFEFLEQQGVRWYAPGEAGEFVPRIPTLRLPTRTQLHQPVMKIRGFWAWEGRGGDDFLWWMARNRLNYWAAAEANQFLAARLGILGSAGSHWIWPDYLSPSAPYPYRLSTQQAPPHLPLDPYPSQPDAGDRDGDGVTTFFEAHPEWYGLRDGKRTPFESVHGVNVCTSNPHVMAELFKRLIQDLSEGRFRDVSILDFWALDGGQWCSCAECARLGTPTDRLLRMVHQLNQALETAEREKRIDRRVRVFFPIYLDTLTPPTRPLPEDFDYTRAFGNFFPIRRSFLYALDNPSSETNAPVWRTIKGWLEPPRHFRGRFVMGEYYGVSTTKNLPVLYTRTMPADVASYHRRLSVDHMHYMHAPTRMLGPRRLNNYLLAKLWWNPQADAGLILDDYFRNVYGRWAEPMRRFYDCLETALAPIHEWKANPQGLARRLAKRQAPYFMLKAHPEKPAPDQPSSWEGSLAAIRECRRIMNDVRRRLVRAGDAASLIALRIAEDERNLSYAENTLALWEGILRTLQRLDAKDRAGAQVAFRATLEPARTLKLETALLMSGSGHSNAPDGLHASLVETLWNELRAELSSPTPPAP